MKQANLREMFVTSKKMQPVTSYLVGYIFGRLFCGTDLILHTWLNKIDNEEMYTVCMYVCICMYV